MSTANNNISISRVASNITNYVIDYERVKIVSRIKIVYENKMYKKISMQVWNWW